MRKISATFIYTANRPPLKYGILTCDDAGNVLEVTDTGGILREQEGLEFYSGILVPGFVNAHCHLELSGLKNKIPEKTGLGGFLGYIHQLRNREELFDENALIQANLQMQQTGTVAAGDVSNSTASLATKCNSRIFYHSFCEAFGFHPSRAEKAFSIVEAVEAAFRSKGLSASVTPHSFYSVSEPLFNRIREKAQQEDSILSIHNQESPAEDMFFRSGSGPIFDHMHKTLNLDVSHWKPRNESMLRLVLNLIPQNCRLLLVHNTFTSANDISIIRNSRDIDNTFFVLCPNSNLYIGNQLPPAPLFQKEKLNICIGTDSLASNHQLSVLTELTTLQQYYPDITLHKLVEWGCLNGARALRIDDRFGSFEKGKNPGINLITGVDLQQLKLTSASRLKVLQRAQ